MRTKLAEEARLDVSAAGAADETCCTMTVTSGVNKNFRKSDAELTDVVDTCDIIDVLNDLQDQAHTRHAELSHESMELMRKLNTATIVDDEVR